MSHVEKHTPEIDPKLSAVAGVVGAPDFIVPWLDRFYDEDDVELLLAVGPAGRDRAAADGGAEARAGASDTPADGGTSLAGVEPARLARAVRRGVLDKDDTGAHTPASLHARLEIWAMFEGWKDVPLAAHRRLADWDVDFYAEDIRADVEAVRDGLSEGKGDYSYVLLHEAQTIIAAQDHIYLWPCDCRSIVAACRKPMFVCLRFSNDRGLGWEISKERAVQLLRAADKAGLMHTADWCEDPRAAGAICNCCTDCCYPHLATERLGTADAWPVRRHVALIDMGTCTACGRCALRCPFGAITSRFGGRPEFEAKLCRGCGLCQTGCSPDAITLLPLAAK